MAMMICTAAVCGGLAPAALAQPAVAAAKQSVEKDLDNLANVLNDENATVDERDEAARRLLSRKSDESKRILLSVLTSVGNRQGQLAVARAIGESSGNDPGFIDPLFAMIGPDRGLTDAAVDALATYKGNRQVLSRLIDLANSREQAGAVRIDCIHALGTLDEKRAAQTLMSILTSDEEAAGIRSAAANALAELTGNRQNDLDLQRWQEWWNANADESDAQWREKLLDERSARLSQLQTRYTQLSEEVQNVLTDQYQLVPDLEKPDLLMRYLKADEPVIRALGARLVFDDVISNRSITDEVRQRLRKMVGDSSPAVRLQVAITLRALNDSEALDALLAQLAQETDPNVKAAIARALAPMRDLRVVPELRKVLHDPSYTAASAAAEALSELAPLMLQRDPKMAAAVTDDLKQVLQKSSDSPGSAALKEAVVQAMASLRQPSLAPVFYKMLTTPEPAGVRRWAIVGLGDLKDSNASDLIINSIDDPDASVRLAAVDALANVGSFENGELLYRRMNQSIEPDATVRDHAWHVLADLLKGAPPQQLSVWADRFSADPAKRIVVLKILAKKQLDNKQLDDLAYTQQNIGECLMKLTDPADAAGYFRQALDYWAKKNEERFTAGLTQQLINALLRAHEYTEAIQFGSSLIQADKSQQMTVGPAIRTEAERLRDTGDLQSALVLIDQAKKMDPPLDPRYAHDLDDIASGIRRKLSGQTTTQPESSRFTSRGAGAVVYRAIGPGNLVRLIP